MAARENIIPTIQRKDSSSSSYVVIKHSWKGKYRRVLVIESTQLLTLDPKTLKLTNCWNYDEVIDVAPLNGDLFKLLLRKKSGNTDLLKFSSEFQREILRDIIRFLPRSSAKGEYAPIQNERDKFKSQYGTDDARMSLHVFTVTKIYDDDQRSKLLLCLTKSFLVERKPEDYQLVTLRPLSDIFALIRSQDEDRKFSIEYASSNKISTYFSTDRDALLASLIDGARSSNNIDIHVKMTPTNVGWRCGPLHVAVDDEIERSHLKAFQTLPPGWTYLDAIYRFNTICPYSGLSYSAPQDNKLFVENKARLIETALMSFINQADSIPVPDMTSRHSKKSLADCEQYYQAIRRLVASKAGFALFNRSESFRAYLGSSIVKTIKLNHDAITHAGLDVLCALMQPMHPDCDISHEQENKKKLLAKKEFLENLLDVFKIHVTRGSGSLVVFSMLDFLTYALCAPYSETTDSSHFDTLLNLVAANGRDIYKLFNHPSLAIVKGAGLVIKAIIQEGEMNVSKRMQELSLAEGALLKHLFMGLYSDFKRNETLGVQYLSRHLVALWSTRNDEARALYKRIFPLGLLNYLDSSEKPPQSMISLPDRDNLKLANDIGNNSSNIVSNKINSLKDMHPSVRVFERQLEQTIMHWREQIGLPKVDEKVNSIPVLRKCRQRVKVEDNWEMFYYQFYQDHCKPDLIWNLNTRQELKHAIKKELDTFESDRNKALGSLISWNNREFKISYETLADEKKIGDYFLRLLLKDSENLLNVIQIMNPLHFFSRLFLRYMSDKRVDMRCVYLEAMATIYGNYMNDIGQFDDMRDIIDRLKDCRNKLERDRLVLLIQKFIMHRSNAEEFIDANGVTILVDMVSLAHLHTERATMPTQTNVIEATMEMLAAAASKEWYYSEDERSDNLVKPTDDNPNQSPSNRSKTLQGPYRFSEIEELFKEKKLNEKTKLWAQGMEGWKMASEIPQIKWCILAPGKPVMNESELATCILNIFIQICEYYPSHDLDGAVLRPFPRIKKYLSNITCLPHIIQLLVTFDPVIVERVSTLMLLVMDENPMISLLYRTGLFFFILMYSGENLLPISRLLHATHLVQSCKIDGKNTQGSFLNCLLPEAMVCYLENHGPDEFAKIFLRKSDSPEAIWNNEMRRTMIEKIACHVADFTSRLKSNNRATYEYFPIAPVSYEQLEDELFVDIYYLRNLCDTVKFPHWPIKDPVNFLKALIVSLYEETSRKPSIFTLEDALVELRLDPKRYRNPEDIDEETIKRSYRDLAKKYHPDKNPDGAEIFERIHKAYEFLCSKQARDRASGPNLKYLILIFKAQSILFCQCNDILSECKYTGYPKLIETIKKEVDDERLFSKPDPLLAYACETAYHTLRCSPKNAQELRQENGLEVLQQALSRCASMLSASSDPDGVCVHMCTHIINCFTIASEFEECQQELIELPSIVKDLNRILSYGKLYTLLLAAAECTAAFAKCPSLHQILYDSGIIFGLILSILKYESDSEEGGNEEKEMTNQTAKVALIACVRMYELGKELFEKPIEAMLTKYVASHFTEETLNYNDLLKMLTSNIEIPYLIWNKATRAELTDYLEIQQKAIIQSGECPDESYGANFEISSHKDELIVGNVFIRIFNEQPSYPLKDAAHLAQALLNYVGSQSQYIQSALSLSSNGSLDSESFRNVEDCLKALSLAIKFNSGVEIKCVGYFKLLFSLLKINQLYNVQNMALNVIRNITSNGRCVIDIANSNVLVYLWMILYNSRSMLQDLVAGPDEQPTSRPIVILETLLPLINKSSKLVEETIAKGGLVYLVDLFCNSSDPDIRIKSADLMSNIMADELSGLKASIILNRFLPKVIIEAIKKSPRDSLNMIDNNQENPELIWNSEVRDHISKSSSKLASEIYDEQARDPSYNWQMKSDFNLLNAFDHNELVIAGVYLRLFNENPKWVLSKPDEFLKELIDSYQAAIESKNSADETNLATMKLALKNLLTTWPVLLERIHITDHIREIVDSISNQPPLSAISAPSADIVGYLQYNKQAPAQPPPINDNS